MTTDQYSRLIGSLSQCAAIGVCFTWATITLLGEYQDITDLNRRCSPTTIQPIVAASKVRPRVSSCCFVCHAQHGLPRRERQRDRPFGRQLGSIVLQGDQMRETGSTGARIDRAERALACADR